MRWPARWRFVVGAREAVGLHREALTEAEGDDTLEAEIHLRLAEGVIMTEDRNRGLEHAELVVQAASRAGDAALRCNALAMFGFLHFRGGRGIPREQMDEALALERSLPQWQVTAQRRRPTVSSSSGRASSSSPGDSSRVAAKT